MTSFVDECYATLARLIAYVGALALFVIVAVHGWDELQLDMTADPAAPPNFVLAERSRPAFAVSSLDTLEKSESYQIFRHPAGGRKDVFHWASAGEKAIAELEIYRPGGEFTASEPAAGDLAVRMADDGARQELEPAGMIESKFGSFALVRRAGRLDPAAACLSFAKRFGDPVMLQISGWSCQGTSLPARRAAIGCMLDRLTLLASGNEPKLAELFAHAELKRSGCAAPAAASADWVTRSDTPGLRGAL
ncbi:hypothetical protein [Bradyrhizobium sp.]|uniref:hypothetical protein n=1 Tax=Bradyrhizobium sp. TaxID=376 RepID=UPI002D80E60A|nr:hypothetical protein [Bradyrhizobium sp.]